VNPIKPKFQNTVKLEIQITDVSREMLTQYAKYTKYTESEIIDQLISEIAEDDYEFLTWLGKRRHKKKIESKILTDLESKTLTDFPEDDED
jgi:hypothetical protein